MPLPFQDDAEPVDRWGAVFFIAGVAFDLTTVQGLEVAGFVVRGLTLLLACFLGPALVRLVGHLRRREWTGLTLGAITFALCALLAGGGRLLLRDFL